MGGSRKPVNSDATRPDDVQADDDGPADDWGGWDPNDHEEFWVRVAAIDLASHDGEDAGDARCRAYGLRDRVHLGRVRDTFDRYFGQSPEFAEAALRARSRAAPVLDASAPTKGVEPAPQAAASPSSTASGVTPDTDAAPCTLERYAELGGAQAAWVREGRDVDALLQQQFGINALDWTNYRAYWTTRIGGDYRIGLRHDELRAHAEQEYLAQVGPSEVDV